MQLNRILRWAITIGLFIIPFIPFVVVTSMFFPFITGKNFTFRILIEIIFALWLILALRDSSVLPKRSPITLAVLGFFSIITLAGLFGVNPYHSFWSNYERMEGLITHLHLFAYFLVVTSILSTEKLWKWFLHTVLLSGVILSGYAILQLRGVLVINQGGVRIDATFGNTVYFATYMLFNVGLAAYYFFRTETKRWFHYGYLALAALFFIMIYYTATRGALLGFVAGTFLTLLLFAIARAGLVRKISLGLLVAGVLLGGSIFLLRDSSFVKNSLTLSRLAKISLNDETTRARFANMGIAWKGFLERPILGWGTENYNLVFNKYYDPRLYGQEQWFDRVHNILFDWLVGAGILGLLAYLALFG